MTVVATSRALAEPGGGVTSPATSSGARAPLYLGDKLKIVFFETVELPGARQGGAAETSQKTFYQRMDLSADYAVDPDGAVSLPRLGRYRAAGRMAHDLAAELAAAFSSVMGRTAEVSVSIADRAPVYVVGPVRAPGAFKHVPGMMVLQAVALAGGLESPLAHTGLLIERAREQEKLQAAMSVLKKGLARQARLAAEHYGYDDVRMPERLVEIAGPRGSETLLQLERAVLVTERSARHHQEIQAAASARAGKVELGALKRKLDQLDRQIAIRGERLADLDKLAVRGHSTRNGPIQVRGEIADLEVRRQDLLLQIDQVEARWEQLTAARSRAAAEAAANLARQIAETEAGIEDAAQTVETARSITALLNERTQHIAWTGTVDGKPAGPVYEIVRQGANGPSILTATETTTLEPGDVLRITIPPAAGRERTRPASAEPT